MRSAIVRIDDSRVEVELIDLVKFRPEALGWHFRYPQGPINTSDLFVMNTKGDEQMFLIRGSSATWSPDSKNIAFHALASGHGLPIKPDPSAV